MITFVSKRIETFFGTQSFSKNLIVPRIKFIEKNLTFKKVSIWFENILKFYNTVEQNVQWKKLPLEIIFILKKSEIGINDKHTVN